MYDVVALGELLIDFTTQSLDADGYPTMIAHPGGAPANFLATVARFGGKTALLSKVGTDAFGIMLTETLRTVGIDTCGLVKTPDTFTTLAFVTLDKTGERSFSFARKPGADTCLRFEEIDLSLIDQARVFHFGTLSLTDEPAKSATQQAVRYAKRQGKLLSFDPNLRLSLWRSSQQVKEQMLWGLEQADVVKISEEEVDFLFGLEAQTGAEYLLSQFGISLVFVTCGARGCFYHNVLGGGYVPSLQNLQVVDTTGAGDIFGGSAMWKLLQTGKHPRELDTQELEEITAFACATAGLSTTRSGGISSIPKPEDVTAARKTI